MSSLIVLHGCRTVQLTKGKNTLIDEADLAKVGKWQWCTKKKSYGFYAERSTSIQCNGVRVNGSQAIHRVILDAPSGVEVDHADGDGLNNTRQNLRLCTTSENMRNRYWRKKSCCKFKGVYRRLGMDRWSAQIYVHGQRHRLGDHRSPEAAARAYDEAALRLHGEFALTNEKIFGPL